MIRSGIVVVFCSLLVLPVVADDADPTDVGGPYVGQFEFAAPAPASIVMRPDGSGPALTSAHLAGGDLVDATIRARVVDSGSLPIWGFPAEDMWLGFQENPGTVAGCVDAGGPLPGGAFSADVNTDTDGWTEWVLPLRGGGSSPGPVTMFLNGVPAYRPDWTYHEPLPLRVNSPDVTGDLLVNLSDIVVFTADLGTQIYRSDFNWDGIVNLSDIVVFTPALGTVCP